MDNFYKFYEKFDPLIVDDQVKDQELNKTFEEHLESYK